MVLARWRQPMVVPPRPLAYPQSAFFRRRPNSVRVCIDSYNEVTPMAVSQELLDILVCPLCKAPLELVHDKTGLKCVQCKRVYPIRDDIPVMLIDEAHIED